MSDVQHIQKLLVPAKEAAAMLSMGRSTFWQAVKNGNLPKPVKIGSATRWRISDLEKLFREDKPLSSDKQDLQSDNR